MITYITLVFSRKWMSLRNEDIQDVRSLPPWILLAVLVFVSLAIISRVPAIAVRDWGWLTLCYGSACIFCVWLRVRTRTTVTSVAIVMSALLLLFCFMQWASWYK